MSMKIGYARVSTEDQNLNLQLDALKAAGCEKIFKDMGISATSQKRVGFDAAMKQLKPSDTFIIWKMDRAFRSLRNAMDVLEALEEKQVEFVSLTDQIDTTTAMGKAMYHIRNAFSEFERSLISERTKEGLKASRKRGQILGRPKKLSKAQIDHAKHLSMNEAMSCGQIAKIFRVDTSTIWRALR